jgi:N-acetylmuramoyl-L-alanine amidase
MEAIPVETGYTLKEFVCDVQESIGATVDGIAGKETLGKTITLSRYINRKHKAVKPVQKRLHALGYTVVGEIDGKTGPLFQKAVKEFQKDNGCFVDGEITKGHLTWRKLLGM